MCSIHFPQHMQEGLLYTITVGNGGAAQAVGTSSASNTAIRMDAFICGSLVDR
jgi:hypothetical protein